MTTLKTNTIAIESAKEVLAKMLHTKVYANESNKGVFTVAAMTALKTSSMKAFGRLPIFRTRFYDNGVETFQQWFNEFSDVNGLMVTVPEHGIWCERTQAGFDLIVRNYVNK